MRRIAVRRAVPGDLVEPTQSSKLDAAASDVHSVAQHAHVPVVSARAEIVHDGVIKVESRGQVLAVVSECVRAERAHVGDHLRRGETVHGNFTLSSAELKCGCRGGGGYIHDLDKIVLEAPAAAVFQSAPNEIGVWGLHAGVQSGACKVENAGDAIRLDELARQVLRSFKIW